MDDAARAILARAQALVGTRFRPQGRSAATGLDCVGLILASFDLATQSVRRNYRHPGLELATVMAEMPPALRRVAPSQRRDGDLLLLGVATNQIHFAVQSPIGFIHADAGIGWVTEVPGPPSWPVLAVYRLRRQRKAKG